MAQLEQGVSAAQEHTKMQAKSQFCPCGQGWWRKPPRNKSAKAKSSPFSVDVRQ